MQVRKEISKIGEEASRQVISLQKGLVLLQNELTSAAASMQEAIDSYNTYGSLPWSLTMDVNIRIASPLSTSARKK